MPLGWLAVPQNLGLLLGCLNHPTVPMQRGGPALSLGLARQRPRPPRARLPAAWAHGMAAQWAPAESLLAPAPAQRSREHRGDVHAAPACCWLCSAGGGCTDPQRGGGDAVPLGQSWLLSPRPVQIPERCCFVPSPPLRVVPSVSGPPVVGGKGRLVQPGVAGVLLSPPGVPCRCLWCIQGTTTGGRRKGREGTRGTRAAGAGEAPDKVK